MLKAILSIGILIRVFKETLLYAGERTKDTVIRLYTAQICPSATQIVTSLFGKKSLLSELVLKYVTDKQAANVGTGVRLLSR